MLSTMNTHHDERCDYCIDQLKSIAAVILMEHEKEERDIFCDSPIQSRACHCWSGWLFFKFRNLYRTQTQHSTYYATSSWYGIIIIKCLRTLDDDGDRAIARFSPRPKQHK